MKERPLPSLASCLFDCSWIFDQQAVYLTSRFDCIICSAYSNWLRVLATYLCDRTKLRIQFAIRIRRPLCRTVLQRRSNTFASPPSPVHPAVRSPLIDPQRTRLPCDSQRHFECNFPFPVLFRLFSSAFAGERCTQKNHNARLE